MARARLPTISAILGSMTGARGSRPGPDGRHDDLAPEDLEGLTLQIPDDARELTTDTPAAELPLVEQPTADPTSEASGPTPAVGTWAERRAARRRRLTITAGVVAVSMLVVAISGAIGAWIVGPQASAPPAVPLASALPPPGQVGGLLPDAVLQDGASTVSARSLRPAVVVLVPSDCDECAELLTTLAPQVGSFGYALVAVGTPGQDDQLAALAESVGTTRLATLTDPQNELGAAYGFTGATVVLVRNDGVVVDVVRDATPGTRIEGALVDMAPAVGLDA